jgi:predicted nucleic acid-binding protein
LIIVDTSVWVDHLRSGDPGLASLLERAQVLMHPFVIGEIALGGLKRRAEVLGLLKLLPNAQQATEAEVMGLIEKERLWETGIGYVDAHLLAAARLTRAPLWTKDRRLTSAAGRLGSAFDPAER